MTELIKQWLAARDNVERANLIEKGTYGAALGCAVPKKIRKALSADIVEGAIIWYVMDDGERYWKLVEYVDCPGCDFKGYTAEDGCRYGLQNAYVGVER